MQNNAFFKNQSLKVGVDVILAVCRRSFEARSYATQCICIDVFRRLILGPDNDDDDDSVGHFHAIGKELVRVVSGKVWSLNVCQ